MPSDKKLAKIDVIYGIKADDSILDIMLTFTDGTYKPFGMNSKWMSPDFLRMVVGQGIFRSDSFELAVNEHLIGVDVHYGPYIVMGLQWHTVKIF